MNGEPRREGRQRIFAEVLDLMPDAVVLRRVEDDRVVEANEAFAEQIGCAREEILGRRLADLPVEEDPADRERYWEALESRGQVRDFPLHVELPGGERRTHLISSKLVDLEGARHVLSVGKDITERERAEEALRRNERRYRSLFEKNVAGTFVTTLDGELLECNESFARMFGYSSREELEGREVEELYRVREDREQYLERLREEGHLAGVELRLQRRDGSPLWVLENSMLVERREGGEPVNMGTLVDITERKRLEAELERMAYHDSLTGLPNRRLLREQGERALAVADRQGERVGLVYVDLSGFKQINDRYGHDVGDRVLAEVGRRLRSRCREADVPARIGGDEFAVLLSGVEDGEGAVVAARRLAGALDEPVRASEATVGVDASVGVALYPDHASDFDQLLSSGDRAMYRAQEGEDDIRLPDEETGLLPREREELEEDLREAVAGKELALYYQPVREPGEGRAAGAEALLRWPHPERGILAAAEFVPLLERMGLVTEVDRWVLGEALRQARRWGDGGPGWVAVNLCSRTFRSPDLVEWLEGLLDEHGVRPERLVLEVSERVVMRDPGLAAEVVSGVRDLGVRVAVDDFGTGRAALTYLRHLAADLLKTDIVCVKEVEGRSRDRELMQGIADLAHRLGSQVVAEGIETAAQHDEVDGTVDYVQGFYTGAPVPPEQFPEPGASGGEGG